jgi:hypothetical protein
MKTQTPGNYPEEIALHLYNTLELLMIGIIVPETCWASNKICNKKHLLHLVGILLSHINDDARSKSLQMKRYVGTSKHLHFSSVWFINKTSYFSCTYRAFSFFIICYFYQQMHIYRVGHEKVARLPFFRCPCDILHRVYFNTIRLAQLCIDAGGNHFKHLLRWFILSAFGYCIDFCIYTMLRTRATFSWPTLYVY